MQVKIRRLKIELTSSDLNKVKIFWKALQSMTRTHCKYTAKLEKLMGQVVGIKDICFVRDDFEQGYYGVGNKSRTLRLIDESELERPTDFNGKNWTVDTCMEEWNWRRPDTQDIVLKHTKNCIKKRR